MSIEASRQAIYNRGARSEESIVSVDETPKMSLRKDDTVHLLGTNTSQCQNNWLVFNHQLLKKLIFLSQYNII